MTTEGQSRRIDSLDGLRAVSIALVVMSHLQITHGVFDRLPPRIGVILCNGDLGVTVFFVISGFLITTLLKRELEAKGSISIRDFYLRRTFRILPAFYAYLGVLALVAYEKIVPFNRAAWLTSALFVRNYAAPVEHVSDWYTAHCWSLSVEEQFYLFWPLMLAFVGLRRGAWCAGGLILAAPLLRVATYVVAPDMRREMTYLVHTRVDSLMWGCLMALIVAKPRVQRILRRAYDLHLPLVAAVFVLVVSGWLRATLRGPYTLLFGYGLEGGSIALVMMWAIERPQTPFGRFLNWAPVRHIGRISYSLYLWQQLLLGLPLPWGLVASFAAAEASFFLIEKPFLRMRARLEARLGVREASLRNVDA